MKKLHTASVHCVLLQVVVHSYLSKKRPPQQFCVVSLEVVVQLFVVLSALAPCSVRVYCLSWKKPLLKVLWANSKHCAVYQTKCSHVSAAKKQDQHTQQPLEAGWGAASAARRAALSLAKYAALGFCTVGFGSGGT